MVFGSSLWLSLERRSQRTRVPSLLENISAPLVRLTGAQVYIGRYLPSDSEQHAESVLRVCHVFARLHWLPESLLSCMNEPYLAGNSGDTAGLKCSDLTANETSTSNFTFFNYLAHTVNDTLPLN